jgi:hypothetical protein
MESRGKNTGHVVRLRLSVPDRRLGETHHSWSEYTASAEEHGIELGVAHAASSNPDHLVTVGNDDFTAFAAPYSFGPAQCGLARWRHNLRELLAMDDPCFPNPFGDHPGSIRTLPRLDLPRSPVLETTKAPGVRFELTT